MRHTKFGIPVPFDSTIPPGSYKLQVAMAFSAQRQLYKVLSNLLTIQIQ